MRKARILLFLGVWVAVLPYLGFPATLKNILFLISGLILSYFGYVFYTEFKAKENETKKNVFDSFLENHNFIEK